MDTEVICHCDRFFIDTGELNSKGNPKLMAIDKRKMLITGDFIGTNLYEVNYLRRKGERLFCVKHLEKPKKSIWLELNPVVPKQKWIRDGSWKQEQFTKWLACHIGIHAAEQMVIQMLTMPPENLAA